jgi:glutaredoxin
MPLLPDVPALILYSRPGCGLCDDARALLHGLLQRRATAGQPVPELIERDIDTDPAWQRAYFATIPVVELGDRRLELVTSAAALRRLLAEGLDG